MAETTARAADPRRHTVTFDDAIVRKFALATAIWGLVSMTAGVFIAMQMVLPQLNLGLEWLSFGRLRPLHTNAAIFAFAGNAIFAGVYYSTQRLCKTRMWSDVLSNLHFWGWQAIIVGAALTLPLGITQGKEYAELEWPLDIAIALVWAGCFGVNFVMTLVIRRERHMYVALWFYLASIITVSVLHIFNSLVVPASGLKSYSVYAGVQDALVQWWYGHNAVAFFLTTPFLGLMYYFLPKAAERPVFSYKLSIVHFWSLIFVYIWAGPHHLHYTALPQWASTFGMLFSIMLWMPSWGGMINGLLTLRGAWHKVAADPVLKFFVVAVTFYGMSTFEGPMLSIKGVNALSHYTDWTIGHVHGGTLGWNGFVTFAMLYWLVPRIWRSRLYSVKMAEWHFWLGTIGIFGYWLSMQWAGITQGLMWRAFDAMGNLAYPDFVETVTKLMPMYWIRAVAGGMYLIGVVLALVNMAMTILKGERPLVPVTIEAAPLSKPWKDPPLPPSRLTNVVGLAHATDRLAKLDWHRRWEVRPIRFSVYVLIAISIGGIVEMVPLFMVKTNVPTIASVAPYTPLELYGRDIYLAEGCYNCHSQMVRPIWAEVVRYGEYSKPGEFVYDHPFQWGSRRIGPDLHRAGGTRSIDWHVRHFENPRQIIAGSIMPTYAHLLEQKIDYESIPGRVAAMATLGVPYSASERANAADLARVQARALADQLRLQGGYADLDDMKVLALAAYIDRLGVDIHKPAPTPEEALADVPATAPRSER